MGKNIVLIFFKYGLSSSFSLQFPIRYFYNHYLVAYKCIPPPKYEKKNNSDTSFFVVFFHNIGPNLTTPTLLFLLISDE